MSYQHTVLPANAALDIRVLPEAGARLTVKYRVYDERYEHARDWREVEHLSFPEAQDVIAAVGDGFLDDLQLQMQF